MKNHTTHFDDCGCLSQRYEFQIACLREAVQQKAAARFIGYQENLGGSPFALFNVTVKGHALDGSTVSGATLQKIGLDIPAHPKYTEWVRDANQK